MNVIFWMLHRFYRLRQRRAERRALRFKKKAEKFFHIVKRSSATEISEEQVE
ncbi:hypothetical protein [Haematobacter missouriensis]|uniref:hypothetical protein n=1 Tax=Haematobacter missouriensis TaxID=366616 RepID=UPI0012EB4CBC|nr:hypothetical protein [Haematobacter missouriensis]